MYTNRIRQYLDEMAAADDTIDETDLQEAEPENTFAKNLRELMTFKAISIKKLCEATGISDRRILTLRSAGIPSAAKARKPEELGAIAEVLGCTVRDLFSDTPTAAADPKAEEMLRVALSGPKRSFVLDALQMAYVAALTSKTSYS